MKINKCKHEFKYSQCGKYKTCLYCGERFLTEYGIKLLGI